MKQGGDESLFERLMRTAEIPDRLIARIADAPIVDDEKMIDEWVGPQRLKLNATELRVLECCSRGLEWREVAEALGLSPDTVSEALSISRHRLRAKTTTQAVANAIRQGLIV